MTQMPERLAREGQTTVQSDFLVETHTADRAITLELRGELDLLSSPVLAQALDQALASDAELLVLDLRQLEFMDSTGLHLVIGAQQRARQSSRRFALVKGGGQVERLLVLAGVTEALTIVESPESLFEVDQAHGKS